MLKNISIYLNFFYRVKFDIFIVCRLILLERLLCNNGKIKLLQVLFSIHVEYARDSILYKLLQYVSQNTLIINVLYRRPLGV